MLRSRAAGDDDAFYSIALQIAASEARQGRRQTAEELRAAVDDARSQNSRGASIPLAFAKPRGNVEGLIELRQPRFHLADVALHDRDRDRLRLLLQQQRRREWLRQHGKHPNRRLLLVGPPGSGKTMTAEALAGDLKLPLLVVRLENLITRFMGETASKLRLIFDEVLSRRAVYLFDEFDAVGSARTATNDVAEMRRVLNSFLQFMEEPSATDSLIIGATNHPEILDRALLRRFDVVLQLELPDDEQIKQVIKANLKPLKVGKIPWIVVLREAEGLSQSEIMRAAEDAVKQAIIEERLTFKAADLITCLQERRNMREAFVGRD